MGFLILENPPHITHAHCFRVEYTDVRPVLLSVQWRSQHIDPHVPNATSSSGWWQLSARALTEEVFPIEGQVVTDPHNGTVKISPVHDEVGLQERTLLERCAMKNEMGLTLYL